jgi:hypothetical protein
MDMFNHVSTVLQNLAVDSSAGANRADGDTTFNYLITFEFVFILCMMREILENTEQLAQALQRKSQDIINAIRLVHTTKTLLDKMRSDDGWETFIYKVVEFYVGHEIDITDMEEAYILCGGRDRHKPNRFNIDHYFKVEVFRATFDTQLAELNLKFNEKVIGLLSICVTLVLKNGYASFQASEICKLVEKYNPTDFNQQERIRLEYQLNHFVVEVARGDYLKRISTLAEICKCLVDMGRHRFFHFS